MIELLLNAVWLTVVAAAFVAVPRRSSRATLGIACILVLLFPIISVSDDLGADGNSLQEIFAVVVALLAILTAFVVLGTTEHRLIAPALVHIATPSDPRSPPRA